MPELSENEQRRLARLQERSAQAVDGFSFSTNLTVPDLLLMLRHDPGLRALIAEVAGAGASGTRLARDAEPGAPLMGHRPAPAALAAQPPRADAGRAPSAGDLRGSLAGPLRLLAILGSDAALRDAWLGAFGENAEGQITRLIVNAGHWDRIEALWDLLAHRCKLEQRAATADEMAAIEESVRVHNLLWEGRQAVIVAAVPDTPFDFAAHERGNTTGQQVRETWLPGLKNAAGQLRKKTLVLTR